jgi:Uma2 family endonuclease
MNAVSPITNLPEKLGLRVENFEMLEEAGAFEGFSKAELIDGDIIVLNAQYARHGLAKTRLLYLLMRRLEEIGSDLTVYSEVSLRVAPDSMPEPDLFLAPCQNFGAVPVDGVALVVEIADTTLATDLGRKAQLYAEAGVPEYWVVDLHGMRVVRHDGPGAEGYARRVEMASGDRLVSATLAGVEVDTRELVG